jgi:hypothetical protein
MPQILAFHRHLLDKCKQLPKLNTNRSFRATPSPHPTGLTFLFNDTYRGTFEEAHRRYNLKRFKTFSYPRI